MLRGTTWGHVRGYAPMLVTAEQYRGDGGVPVEFDVRSLQQFADQPLAELVSTYDVLVFDHPFIGEAAERGLLAPLDDLLPGSLLADAAAGSVGPSSESYRWAGSAYALPIDAAFHVSARRPDLMSEAPSDIGDLPALARATSRSGAQVALPLRAIDVWCLFLTLCTGRGEVPFVRPDTVVAREAGLEVLTLLQETAPFLHPGSWDWDPIQLLDAMSTTDSVAYCPALFGYVNYATTGFRPRLVSFDEVPHWGDAPCRPVLGGAGIAIAASSRHPAEAAGYLAYVASREIQAGAYARSGGQPAHRAAWQDEHLDEAAHGFYSRTLAAGDNAYLRPRWPGFIPFQTSAAELLRAVLADGLSAHAALSAIDAEYRRIAPSTD
jgi:multiple sugar transport system substrate-binding protein